MHPLVLAFSVLVVAATLRAPITSVGPVLDQIAAETGMGATELGILGATPVIAFAVVSPFVHVLSGRWGSSRTLLGALTVLLVATVARSAIPGTAALWVGTAIIGAAIAVGNVLVPATVKEDFPRRIAVLTGAYSAVLGGFAGIASGLSLPIANATTWRVAIGVWAVLVVVALAVWLWRMRLVGAAPARPAVAPATVSMWTSSTAWWVALFLGTQSTCFYLLITWLPTIEADTGVDPVVAGWHLMLFQLLGVVAGPGITVFLHGRGDLRVVAVVISAGMVLAMAGLALAPAWVVAWVILAGLSSGSSLVLALTFVAQRARTAAGVGRLSSMAQGVGYALAALGPIAAGLLLDATGRWQPVVWTVAGIALAQLVVGVLAGRDRYTHPAPAPTG